LLIESDNRKRECTKSKLEADVDDEELELLNEDIEVKLKRI